MHEADESGFLDNIIYGCLRHVFYTIHGLQLNGAIILSAGCIQKGSVFCEV